MQNNPETSKDKLHLFTAKRHHVCVLALAICSEAIPGGAHRAGVLPFGGARLAAVNDTGAANTALHILRMAPNTRGKLIRSHPEHLKEASGYGSLLMRCELMNCPNQNGVPKRF